MIFSQLKISEFKKLSEYILLEKNIDYSEYAYSSIKRRIETIMENHKIIDCDELLHHIASDESFFKIVIHELRVPITEMFRDPDFWKSMMLNIFPKLFKKQQTILIQVPQCSSGEELYSLLILLNEYLPSKNYKIFADDISEKNIETIKAGIYSLKQLETAQKNYDVLGLKNPFSDYYTKTNSNFHLNNSLLNNVELSVQNFEKIQHETKFDLILYRNQLIYFTPQLQSKILKNIYNSLNKGSWLVIGIGENLTIHQDIKFSPVDKSEKIFKKYRF